MEGDLPAGDEVMGRSRRERTGVVAGDRATEGVAHARHRYAVNFEMGSAATDPVAPLLPCYRCKVR